MHRWFHTFCIKKGWKDGLVVAIEPEPANFEALKRNTEGLSNVITINKAIWDKKGKKRLYIAEKGIDEHSLISSVDKNWAGVETDTIDNIIKAQGLKGVDFLKMDVEGAEIEALKGANDTLRKTRIVVIAGYHKRAGKKTFYRTRKLLNNLGFKTRVDYEGLVHGVISYR